MNDDARQLYSIPPTEFVAARNQLAKSLKAAGDTDGATFVAALKRPKITEWAVNRVAHEQPAITARWAAAIVVANAAQADAIGAGSRGEGFRSAADELKAATNALVDAATDGGDDARRFDIADLVRSLMVGNGPDLLVAGVVGSADVSEDEGFFPGATASAVSGNAPVVRGKPAPRPAAERAAGPKAAKPTKAAPSKPTRIEAREREQLTSKIARIQTELTDAKAAVAETTKTIERARRELDRAERSLPVQTANVDQAKAKIAELSEQLRRLG